VKEGEGDEWMRADDELQEGTLSYISPEKRARGSSFSTDPHDGGRGSERDVAEVREAVFRRGAPVDCAGAAVAVPAVADFLFGAAASACWTEQLQYNMLFRWFVGMEMDETVWNHAVYGKNWERVLNEEIAESLFRLVLERAKPYMPEEHFTVDGTLIEAWASHKSFRRKDESGKPPGAGGDVDFSGE
jgi:hypothetical protein